MATVIATQALLNILNDARLDADELNGVLHLYKNNFTPAITSVAGDFTEADFSGYAPYDFSAGGQNWPAAAADGSNNAESAHAIIDFIHNGGGTPNDIYGWYIVDGAGNLIAAERLPGAPFTCAVLGAKVSVTPTAKLKR